jgi:hypothetical protein
MRIRSIFLRFLGSALIAGLREGLALPAVAGMVALLPIALAPTPTRAGSATIKEPAQSDMIYTVGTVPPNTYLTGNVSMTIPNSGVGFGTVCVGAGPGPENPPTSARI